MSDIYGRHKYTARFPHVKFYGDCSIKSGVEIGEGTQIGEYVVISHDAKIGKNCRVFYHVSICKDAVIGDNVFLGPKVTFLNDKFPPSKVSNPPIIEDDVVVGACCVLFPGVRVGRGAKVGAGCRVTRDVPPDSEWFVEKIVY